ncbi:hypothetical protein D3C72_754730 [compost metagenome]
MTMSCGLKPYFAINSSRMAVTSLTQPLRSVMPSFVPVMAEGARYLLMPISKARLVSAEATDSVPAMTPNRVAPSSSSLTFMVGEFL